MLQSILLKNGTVVEDVSRWGTKYFKKGSEGKEVYDKDDVEMELASASLTLGHLSGETENEGRNSLLAFHKTFTEKAFATMEKKNSDYAGEADPYANFRLAEIMGVASVEQAIFIRMGDKFARLANAVAGKELKVSDESINDTLEDLLNYTVILAAYIKDKKEKTQ